jgi:hypothetical protein
MALEVKLLFGGLAWIILGFIFNLWMWLVEKKYFNDFHLALVTRAAENPNSMSTLGLVYSFFISVFLAPSVYILTWVQIARWHVGNFFWQRKSS